MDINLNTRVDAESLHKKVESLGEAKDDEALKKVSREFESLFISIMFKEMQKTVPEDGLVEKSSARRIFEEMYMEELSNEVSKNGGFGIGEMLYEQFKKGYVSW